VIGNIYHDILFAYGFTPATGNFQNLNGGDGREGGDNDAITVVVQDGARNNANFGSGPDGKPGIMRLSLFTLTSPNRDSALESDIMVHELTHGLTNRLTGGAGNANCMNQNVSRGMGEGWSDIVALVFKMKLSSTRNQNHGIGQYVSGDDQKGIRSFLYTSDMNANPLTYSMAAGRTSSVHSLGVIWASVLYEVYWNLVEAHGFGKLKEIGSGKGNVIFMQLLVDGMKLQPCNPNFIQARDAFILADKTNNAGANECLIWRGFAKRGLGVAADENFAESFDVPQQCS
jgi:extracellular elastinolytic metalloproteinase